MSSHRVPLHYDILDVGSIVSLTPITSISAKYVSTFQLMSLESTFLFTLQFHQPSQVQLIKVKGFFTHMVELTFLTQDKLLIGTKTITFNRKDEGKLIQWKERGYAEFVEVRLINNPDEMLLMGLNYLLFEGLKGQKGKKYRVNQAYLPPNIKISVPSALQKQKEKEIEIQQKKGKHNISEIYYQDADQISNHNSHYTQKQKKNYMNYIELDPNFQQSFNNYQTFNSDFLVIQEEGIKKPYPLIQYKQQSKMTDILQMVNKKWVQAQKKVQDQKHILDDNRLSRRCFVKYLYKKTFYIDQTQYTPQIRENLSRMVIQLGGQVIERPIKGSCIIVAMASQQKKYKRKNKYKGYTIVSEQFIEHTMKYGENQIVNYKLTR